MFTLSAIILNLFWYHARLSIDSHQSRVIQIQSENIFSRSFLNRLDFQLFAFAQFAYFLHQHIEPFDTPSTWRCAKWIHHLCPERKNRALRVFYHNMRFTINFMVSRSAKMNPGICRLFPCRSKSWKDTGEKLNPMNWLHSSPSGIKLYIGVIRCKPFFLIYHPDI